MKPWSIILLLIIIADSLFTIYIGTETNPLHLWIMSKFDLSLAQAMILRVFYLLPFVWIINKWYEAKYVVIMYISIYILSFGAQNLL